MSSNNEHMNDETLDESMETMKDKLISDVERSQKDSPRASRTSDVGASDETNSKSGSKSSSTSKNEKKFPWILHKIIDDAEREGNEDIVAWTPSGRSFIVRKRDTFTEQILPRYFRQTKYKSFVRQLNLWGFTYIDQGPDKGSCKSEFDFGCGQNRNFSLSQ